jgi:hypothetical protein
LLRLKVSFRDPPATGPALPSGPSGRKEAAMRFALALVAFASALVAAASAASDWCYDNGDYIYATVADGAITVHHDAAFYNCEPDSMGYTWTPQGSTFLVVETEYNPHAMCFCCFNYTTVMEHVPAGAYGIDFQWNDFETGPQHRLLDVYVPDEGQSGDPANGGHTTTNCLQEQSASADPSAPRPAGIVLHSAQPNPVGERALLRFETPAAGRVTLAVYAGDGSRVRLLVDEDLSAGSHTAVWDGRDELGRRVAQGIYFAGASAAGERSVRRVLLVR